MYELTVARDFARALTSCKISYLGIKMPIFISVKVPSKSTVTEVVSYIQKDAGSYPACWKSFRLLSYTFLLSVMNTSHAKSMILFFVKVW